MADSSPFSCLPRTNKGRQKNSITMQQHHLTEDQQIQGNSWGKFSNQWNKNVRKQRNEEQEHKRGGKRRGTPTDLNGGHWKKKFYPKPWTPNSTQTLTPSVVLLLCCKPPSFILISLVSLCGTPSTPCLDALKVSDKSGTLEKCIKAFKQEYNYYSHSQHAMKALKY